MGYRSEVYFGVRKKHKEQLAKVLEKHELSNHLDVIERNHSYSPKGDGNYVDDFWIIIRGEYLKWYIEYEDVKEITNFIQDVCDQSQEENGDGDSFMVCMGEDGEVHNEIGEYWNCVDIIKTIGIR